jgi:hypothetical protein
MNPKTPPVSFGFLLLFPLRGVLRILIVFRLVLVFNVGFRLAFGNLILSSFQRLMVTAKGQRLIF